MSAPRKIVWGMVIVFGLFFLMGIITIGSLVSKVSKAHDIKPNSVLEITLSGPLSEGSAQNPIRQALDRFGGDEQPSLWDIREALEAAATDERIKAVRLDLKTAAISWAAADELHEDFARFRSSKKPIHAYVVTDFADDSQYYTATAADQIHIGPEAALLVNGLRMEVTFWKGTLDKLHITPHYLMYKEYKSAGEPMSRTEMSEYFREALSAVGEDIYARMIETVAARRGLESGKVREAVDTGLMTATQALEGRYVDALSQEEDVREALRNLAGAEKYEGVSATSYLAALRQKQKKEEAPHIAVLFAQGPIVSVGDQNPFGDPMIVGPALARDIQDAIEDENTKAIVMRVNSPGGSAVGSDHIWKAMQRARAKGKPVVVSMSSVAGSGGYWISIGADKIVAQPTTITGSIGVVFGKFNMRGFYEWIGANVSDVTLGRNADILSVFEPLEPEHEAAFRSWMEEVYTHFKGKVADGRKLEVGRVEEIARGRIWSGQDAKELGLIDEVGGIEVALKLARELAGDATLKAQVHPAPKGLLEALQSGKMTARGHSTPLGSVFSLLNRHDPGMSSLEPMIRDLESPHPWVLMPEVVVR